MAPGSAEVLQNFADLLRRGELAPEYFRTALEDAVRGHADGLAKGNGVDREGGGGEKEGMSTIGWVILIGANLPV